eukprot:TRINITY_DN3457_c0_g1_i1.p1 TRINITY_DN3457_c0_g1~~TRINITY_DN3457_c0_g1_i1.p1  ORF type:complete len:243 (+),score=65.92 TRINITY_DN3457_c0_g1_i1:53-781(+)
MTSDLDHYQAALMAEECIVVDRDDNVIGPESKLNCHLNTNIQKGLLHRAFSVFLFDTQGRLLIQQRSGTKATFKLCWTNTCCSHPLYFPTEMEDKDQLGVIRAAIRKLDHELGISPDSMPIEAFTCLARVHYKAESNGKWGEHEIDYILVAQKDVTVVPNPEEVADFKYVTLPELEGMLARAKLGEGTEVGVSGSSDVYVTPWFQLIATPSEGASQSLLGTWWQALGPNIKSLQNLHIQHFA